MSTKNLKKLVKNAKLGTFGKNWKYVGNRAEKELVDLEADSLALSGDLICGACGFEIEEDEELTVDADGLYFHKSCFDGSNDE